MTRRILLSLALLALTAAISVGLLHAQESTEGERPPYRIGLHPGWNLISFPGDPVDPLLENVIGDAQVDIVLGYEDDQWGAAVRRADGGWHTTSGFTTMSGVRGYWVHATAADAIETVLSQDTARQSPEGCGWQLMGIRDAEQRAAGTKTNADEYFANVNWRVAYGFVTEANQWTKLLPDSEGRVEVGQGYWVWVSAIHGHTFDGPYSSCPWE